MNRIGHLPVLLLVALVVGLVAGRFMNRAQDEKLAKCQKDLAWETGEKERFAAAYMTALGHLRDGKRMARR